MSRQYMNASALILVLLISGCVSQHQVEIPPTAAGDEVPTGALTFELWPDVNDPSAQAGWYDLLSTAAARTSFIAAADIASMPENLFAARMSGYFIPPEDGSYVLAIAGEQTGALYFSATALGTNLDLAASFAAATGRRVWNKFDSQLSPPYSLKSGMRYPFDAFFWDKASYDYLAVGWAKVNSDGSLTAFQPIAGETVAPRLSLESGGADVEAYQTGYRVGYTDGRYSFPFDLTFPFKDSDGDGLPDNWEIAHGLDPHNDTDALLDADGDGLYALLEFALGSSPVKADTDGDGLPDGWEYNKGLNALDMQDALAIDAATGLAYLELYKKETGPEYVLSFSWDPVLVRGDGSLLAENEISALVVKYGLARNKLNGEYTVSAARSGTVSVPVNELATYYVSIQVRDTSGILGEASPVVEITAIKAK